MNKSILSSILKPIENPEVFNEIMGKLSDDPKTSWYPSSGGDYRDLLYLTKEYFQLRRGLQSKVESVTFPELFIHTDYDSRYTNLIEKGIIREDKGTVMKVTSQVKCTLNKSVDYEIDSRLILFLREAFRIPTCYLMNIEVSSKGMGTYNRIVVYFFMENFNFFREIVLKKNLKISHISNIRDGSVSGGGHINMKFLEYFLGYMQTELFISDNIGRNYNGFDLIKDDKTLIEKYKSPLNVPISVEGVGKIHWSDYGVFLGDSLIFKINRFPEK